MTTLFNFVQPPNSLYQFSPVLDGNTYSATVYWNYPGQRYYIQVTDLDGTLIFALPLIGSPTGYFIESIAWSFGTVVVNTSMPHGYALGSTIDLTLVGCAPDVFNGLFRCLITAEDQFSYPLAANPGIATALGQVNYDINIAAGYFNSTLIWREPNQQFEVSP